VNETLSIHEEDSVAALLAEALGAHHLDEVGGEPEPALPAPAITMR
jgi:hypothetical protein